MIPKVNNLLYPELSFKICGLCFETHNKLGRYLNEKQYADYLEQLFKDNNIILDLKAKYIVTKDDYFQMQRYLNSYNKKLGLIINFRRKYLAPKRIINSNFKELEPVATEPVNIFSKLRNFIKH
jgi:hypothetical protein